MGLTNNKGWTLEEDFCQHVNPPYERLVVKQRVQIFKTRNYDKAPKRIYKARGKCPKKTEKSTKESQRKKA